MNNDAQFLSECHEADKMFEFIKQQSKERRQDIKLQCLEAALRHTAKLDVTENYVVEAAKAFYAFVRT